MIFPGGDPKRVRMVSVVAATVIALACGTNYAYSAWAPQFAERLNLSSTQSNLIGTFGNLGMYASGIPLGMMVDAKTPRWGVALGAIFFAVGYYPIAKAYDAGPGAYSMFSMCLFSFFTGCGSASAFTAAIKVAALNFPDSRGTATAFPLSAFGLSASFFSALALILPHGTYNFLLLLSTATFLLPVMGFLFIDVLPPHAYDSLPQHENRALPMRRSSDEPRSQTSAENRHGLPSGQAEEDPKADDAEDSSLLTSTSGEDVEVSKRHSSSANEPPHLDIRGWALLPYPEFWQLFGMMGLMTGIGLMTINNIGNDAQALWKHFDTNIDPHYIEKRQTMHVSLISVGSFTGRLLSGIGSDVLVSKLNRSRFWCLFASAVIFCLAQFLGTAVGHPKYLFVVSSFTGLAYGMLFGVYPSLVAHTFGVHGLSQNWGTMTLAPVISGNIFNILYGKIYDSHSIVENGHHECLEGLQCYRAAYWVTFWSAVVAVGLCLWSIWHENEVHKKRDANKARTDHDRLA